MPELVHQSEYASSRTYTEGLSDESPPFGYLVGHLFTKFFNKSCFHLASREGRRGRKVTLLNEDLLV